MNERFDEACKLYLRAPLDSVLCDVDSGHLPALVACRLLGVSAVELKRLLHGFGERTAHRRSSYDACVVAALWRTGRLTLTEPEPFFRARLDGLATQLARETIFKEWIDLFPGTAG